MTLPLDFKTKEAFRVWLMENHERCAGSDIFMYKKGYQHLGLGYEDAVRTALCYGWIDSVTHSYDEVKFIQYFSQRREKSNWSLSNIKRMKQLIEQGEMTEYGLRYFDQNLLDQLDELIERDRLEKEKGVEVPDFFKSVLEEENATELFEKTAFSQQKMFVAYISDAKKEQTKLNRCMKVIGILRGDKNNL
ncbi:MULTISPECIES: YdeI family protein [unclassified Fusibacter]|uniref:YdeI/OmpD-associated family protein n=1 Tax=unclassified Fusibacter TaxID=2624464 RepID=UPI00101112F8|nr:MULTISPECIES: YdeI/OmpD-associated family protein [unclassified Fusibacter]MCK8058494.1 YdeI/OmpD-associated family protein [Fusibacter sp. A2]NPE22737.1 hypothetical protein [Fusibacter sp. A1]RXV60296.1 hypothetical protein DWB64_12890 [Fusibacter sp. A1]